MGHAPPYKRVPVGGRKKVFNINVAFGFHSGG
jgi:hypothetical protein